MTTLSEALRGVMLRDEIGDGDRFVLEQAADALENTDLSRGGDSPRQHRTQAGEEPATTPDAALDAEADALRVACGGIFSWDDIGKGAQNDWRAVALKAREMHRRSVELIEPKHADLLRERDEWRDQWKEMARSKWSQLKDAERERDEARAEVERLKREGSPGVLHAVDQAFLEVTVKERNAARSEAATLRAEVERLRAALDEVGRGGPVWMNDRDGATVIRSMHAKIKEGVAEIQRLRGEASLRSDPPHRDPPTHLRGEPLDAWFKVVELCEKRTDLHGTAAITRIVAQYDALRADNARLTNERNEALKAKYDALRAAPPVVNVTDIEAAVKEWGDWTDWLTAVLRKHTRPLDREGLIGAMIEFRHRVQMEGGIPAIPGYADAVLRHIGAQAAQPVDRSEEPILDLATIIDEATRCLMLTVIQAMALRTIIERNLRPGFALAEPKPPEPKIVGHRLDRFTLAEKPAWTENDTIRALTAAMREADEVFERVGGSTRHHVRDCLLPVLEKHGIAVVPVTAPKLRVKLPPRKIPEDYFGIAQLCARAHNDGINACAALLRERGVEVDGE